MKKLVAGLAGIVVGISFAPGCRMVYQANEDVNRIRQHHNAVKKIIGAEPNDSYHIFEPEKEGDSFKVYIVREDGHIDIVSYYDTNGDGKYEAKSDKPPRILIPDKLDIKVLPPPDQNTPQIPKYKLPIPKEKLNKQKLV